jgi:DNA-binding CsgD family transcriptional regulator
MDQSDRIWLGTIDNGLILIDEAGSAYQHFKHNNADSSSISNNEIRSIFQDSKGEIWIGTEGGGINQWLGENRFNRISETDGLIANSVMAISEDKSGMIWASTFQGISRIDNDKDIINFDFRTFQNTNQFNQNAILTDQSGKLYFGGINGMHSISPEEVKEDTLHPELIFTDLKIFGRSVPVGNLPDGRIILDKPIEASDDIWLNYSDLSFTIDFTAIDYTNPLDKDFSFMLEGFNEEWEKTPQGKPSVTYTNLDPGSYVFKVRHKDQLSSIQIHVKPPFWRTIWFRLLAILTILALLIYGLRFWIKRKEAAANRKILQLKNENLATEVEAKNSKLMFFSAQMAHKNELLTELKAKLVSFGKNPKDNFRALIRQLDHELINEDYWNEFNLYFNEVDKKFLDRIIKIHPGLTKNDLRLCSLLRMNLSTKEIASLLNITVRAVEQSRYRLKKRMNLGKEQDLLSYMASIG